MLYRIWGHLEELTFKNVTIILTTHYTQEAGRAQMLGFLRNGRLLAQNEPRLLRIYHDCERLDDIFLSFCTTDENTENMSERESSVQPIRNEETHHFKM